MTLRQILLLDMYNILSDILKKVSDTYELNFQELHELYLKEIDIELSMPI